MLMIEFLSTINIFGDNNVQIGLSMFIMLISYNLEKTFSHKEKTQLNFTTETQRGVPKNVINFLM